MKTILITGANSGIGKALAIIFAKKQYQLILLVRRKEDIVPLKNEIQTISHNSNLTLWACDLSSQQEIEHCCKHIQEKSTSIDIVVNNAGVYTETRMETSDNIELTLAVNVLAPYILTLSLLPLLERGHHPSVFNISSIGEKYGHVDFDDIQSLQNYSGNSVYNKSKLLLTMLTYKFADLYADRNIVFNCIHPGATKTNLVSERDVHKMPFLLRAIFNLVKRFRQKPMDSAHKIYDVITKVEVSRANKMFFSNGKAIQSSTQSRDQNLINKTWEMCQELTQISPAIDL